MTSIIAVAVTLAEKQHGVFAHYQLGALSHHVIDHQVRTGAWQRLYEGVYRMAGTPRTWRQALMAAVLAAGPGAVASHRAAAALLGIPGFPEGIIEVTTPRFRRHRQRRVHQSRDLRPDHITIIDGIPVTRVPRTIVDLAATKHAARVERALDNCLSMNLTNLISVRVVALDLAKKGRTGIGLMRELLEARGDSFVPPASELEAEFRKLVRRAGLPGPVAQLDIGDDEEWIARVDFAYPTVKLVIELDSVRHHSAKLDQEHDAEREERITAAGWEVIRFTWWDVMDRPGWVLSELRRRVLIAA
jgi:hypothetical protein